MCRHHEPGLECWIRSVLMSREYPYGRVQGGRCSYSNMDDENGWLLFCCFLPAPRSCCPAAGFQGRLAPTASIATPAASKSIRCSPTGLLAGCSVPPFHLHHTSRLLSQNLSRKTRYMHFPYLVLILIRHLLENKKPNGGRSIGKQKQITTRRPFLSSLSPPSPLVHAL